MKRMLVAVAVMTALCSGGALAQGLFLARHVTEPSR